MPVKKYIKKNSIVEIFPSQSSLDEVDKAPNNYHVTPLDIFGLVYSIIIHIVDVAFDINVAYHYFKYGQYTYFVWTISFMLIPALIITIISIRMYVVDNDRSSVSRIAVQRRFLLILVLLLQLASVMRYCDSLNYALRSRRAEKQKDRKRQEEYYKKMLNEDSDVALLRVFECYLESAPQQILQITILLVDYSYGSTFHVLQQCLSIGSSFLAMAWCMASYHRSIRFDQEDKNNISWKGTGVQFLWHLNVTISRIVSISIVASLYPFWSCIAVGIHWLAMTIWLSVISNASFCGGSRILQISFTATLGLVYIFNFISLREGPTRFYYLGYYPSCFIENMAAITIWALLSDKSVRNSWYYYPLIIIPTVTFLLGMLFLIIYYKFLHPSKSFSSHYVQTVENKMGKSSEQGSGTKSYNGNVNKNVDVDDEKIAEAKSELLQNEEIKVEISNSQN